jgi:citrate lyase beta subunit
MTLVVRTNSLESGLFETDVDEILNADTVNQIDGFCVTKVNTVEMA